MFFRVFQEEVGVVAEVVVEEVEEVVGTLPPPRNPKVVMELHPEVCLYIVHTLLKTFNI